MRFDALYVHSGQLPEITYESDEKLCFDCQETRKNKTHLLFWFSSTYCRRICQGCAKRAGGKIREALEQFLRPFDYRAKAVLYDD